MSRNIMKILICSLVLLVGIGAVNAMELNTTDEAMALEENVTFDDINEVLSIENTNEDTCISEGYDEYLHAGVSDKNISASEYTNVIKVDNNSADEIAISDCGEVLNEVSVNNSQGLIASVPPSDVPVGNLEIKHSNNLGIQKAERGYELITKELVFAKVKISKKDYNRFLKKTPSKKNKKLWKKYKKFKKAYKKKLKKSKNKKVKAIKKKWKIDWYYGIRPILVIKSKYCTMNWVCMCYKRI